MGLGRRCVVILLLSTGCDDAIDLDPLDKTPPIEATVRPKPISGGTLLITADDVAVGADPDRDLVHVVDLESRAVRHTIALEPGDEPGRVVAGSDGRVHVVLRGYGGVATIDLAAGTVLARHWVCSEPRGIAYDPTDSTLHVACADGTLAQLDAASGEELVRTQLDPDLRDVVLLDGVVHVSQFRAASIVRGDGSRVSIPDSGNRKARVAWRTWADHRLGGIAMLHQMASTDEVPIDLGPEDVAGGAPYGGGGGGCEPGITAPVLSIVREEGIETIALADARLTVDLAFAPNGEWLALAMPGAEKGRASVQTPRLGQPCLDGDGDDIPALAEVGQITSVAFAASGSLVMQSREPARIVIQHSPPHGENIDIIELEGDARFDSGHDIFHRATESGLSCASCHPEGADDGHVWTFEGLGKRRTQTLDIGLADTAPFHWDGEMEDLDMIVAEVLAHRMGGERQSKARGESFGRWMFEQRRPPADAISGEPAIVDNGEALFAAYACDKCHDGPELGGTTTESFRGALLQVPSLRRVSLRPPFMHDGRAATLDSAVRDMIAATTTADPPQANVDAIVAYLRTL